MYVKGNVYRRILVCKWCVERNSFVCEQRVYMKKLLCDNIVSIATSFSATGPSMTWWLATGFFLVRCVGRGSIHHWWRLNWGVASWSSIWDIHWTRIRNVARVLISKERKRLKRWVDGDWSRRDMYGNWIWVRLTNDSRRVNCTPWEHDSDSLLILHIKIFYIRFKRCLLFSEFILFLH